MGYSRGAWESAKRDSSEHARAVGEAAHLLQLLRTMGTNLNDVSMLRGQASLGPGSENRVGVQGERVLA